MAELICIGPATTVTQNVVYSLPARLVFVTSVAAIDVSVNSSTWNALTGANTVGAYTSAVFLRCTTGNTVVTCKV